MVGRTRRQRAFTLVELLVVIAIIGILAGLVVPNLMQSQAEGLKLKCKANLRAIYIAAYSYSLKSYAFPLAPGTRPAAHDSFNLLLRTTHGQGLEPVSFVCPAGEAQPAQVVNGKFVLDDTSNSYAWVGTRTKCTELKAILASDKYVEGEDIDYPHGQAHSGHQGVVNVVYSNGSIVDLDVFEDADHLTDDYLPTGLVR